MTDALIHILRAQAWERAKGELQAVLATYYSSIIAGDEAKFESMLAATSNFISEVDDNSLAE